MSSAVDRIAGSRDQCRGAAVGQQPSEFVGLGRRVDHNEHAVGLDGREDPHRRFQAVGQVEHHAIAACKALGRTAPGPAGWPGCPSAHTSAAGHRSRWRSLSGVCRAFSSRKSFTKCILVSPREPYRQSHAGCWILHCMYEAILSTESKLSGTISSHSDAERGFHETRSTPRHQVESTTPSSKQRGVITKREAFGAQQEVLSQETTDRFLQVHESVSLVFAVCQVLRGCRRRVEAAW